MRRILIVTVGIKSHLYVHLAFALRAQAIGYEVALACPDSSIAPDVSNAGREFFHLKPPRGRWRVAPYAGGLAGWIGGRTHTSQREEAVQSGLGLDAVFDAYDPDLVVVDVEMHEHILVACLAGRKTATMESHLSTRRRANVPILSDSFAPQNSLRSRLRCAFGWQVAVSKRRLSMLLRRLATFGNDKYSAMRRLAASKGVSFDRIIDTGQWQHCVLKPVPCLRMTVPELDFEPREDTAGQHFVGPMILAAERRSRDPKLLAEIDGFLASRPDDLPVILMSFGSLKTSPERIRAGIEAVRDKPATLLVSSGADDAKLHQANLPENVFARPWLPFLDLLPHASLVVSHGGVATMHESIAAGVPLLLYSMGIMDMPGNTTRVAAKGLGLAGDAGDSPAQMWLHMYSLLNEAGYAERCRKMAAHFTDYGTEARLEAALSACIDGSPAGSG